MASATDIKGSMLQGLAKEYLMATSPAGEEPETLPRNGTWVARAFAMKPGSLGENEVRNRRYTSASFKYTDSSIGGNLCINPPSQFTRFADIRDTGVRAYAVETRRDYVAGSPGMGRYYSEAIDDNNQIVHFRMGVPAYNSLMQFFTGFYDSGAAMMARTGRMSEGFLNSLLRTAGNVLGLLIMPLAIIPWGIMMLGQMVRFFMRWPASKFYYLKPAMPIYYAAVTNMVNQISVNMGITSYSHLEQIDNIIGKEHKFSGGELSQFHDILPDIIDEKGVVNVYAIFNKAKRLQMRHEFLMDKLLNSEKGKTDMFGVVRAVVDDKMGIDKEELNQPKKLSLETLMLSWWEADKLSKIASDTGSAAEKSPRINIYPGKVSETQKYGPQYPEDDFVTYAIAEKADGATWLSLRVDYTGSVQESFSNSFSESSLKSTINSASKAARSLRINLAEGNFDSLGITQTIIDGAKTILTGAADVLQIDGIAAFAGSAFVDIPDYWDDSSASFPKTTYVVKLPCAYNNPMHKLFKQVVPLCSILAMGMPLSTGKQSYTSPYMLEMYDRGRTMKRLCMIESITVTRGTGNIGFTNQGHALGIEVSFTVRDMSSVISMPIQPGFSLFKGIFDSENNFTDYMMVLSGMKLKDVDSRWEIMKYQMAAKRAELSKLTTASYWASKMVNFPDAGLIRAIMRGTDKE
jgi:hypothetical protein